MVARAVHEAPQAPQGDRLRIAPRAAGILLAAAWAACAEPPPLDHPNVVLVCIDTLRADHLGCYGYERDTTPAIDRLAAESTVFADACAASSWTRPSVPSLLTGTYPLQHGLYGLEGKLTHALSDASVTLAEVFRDHGWRTAAVVCNPQLDLGNGFEQGFEDYRDDSGDAAEIERRAQTWLDSLDGEDPFFLYLHFLDAHWPYPIPDAYATRFGGSSLPELWGAEPGRVRDAINEGDRQSTRAELDRLRALYDGGIRYVDDQLALLFASLEERGLADDTIVCIVSDHGEEFMEHGRIGHGHGLQENLLRVPWILHVPGRRGRRVEHPVGLVDVFPTLLAAAGVEAPASEGVDRLTRPGEDRPVFAELKELRRYQQSLRRGSRKVTRRFVLEAPAPGEGAAADGDEPAPLLSRDGIPRLILEVEPPGVRSIDLAADPSEHDFRFDTSHSDPLEAELDALSKRFAAAADFDGTGARELDAATLEKLRQLGYTH